MNSQRRIHNPSDNKLKLKSYSNLEANFHRERNQSMGKAIKITESLKQKDKEEFPTPQKYKKPTIFDPEKAQLVKKGYRDGHEDNPNKIINNNTKFRIFNEISPKDHKIPPLDNLNDNPNKWKPRMTYYFRENQGDITQPMDYKTDRNYGYTGVKDKSREARLAHSKRKLQNYLNLVSTDPRQLNKKYQERMASKSVLTKLSEHDNDSYAVREMARHGPTNKTVVKMNKLNKASGSGTFGKAKYSVPSYPVLDIQKRKIVNKESNLDLSESRRYNTLENSNEERRSFSNVNQNIISPSNPNPAKFQNNVSKLELNNHNNFDKVGSVTYRDNNSKAVYPLNNKTNIKKQITSVFERNNKVMHEKFPTVSPVFKPAIPRKIEIEHNPLRKLDATDYSRTTRKLQQPIIYKSTRTPEFVDLLSMSRKLDIAAKVGKNS
ncbi:unnamed protein product [Moneuplotes crassus]|uniref:Uncharacterized protein n=1 Tax=Euplotes crassus TaxID=5936 RepID=A0AAD1UL69_EUPCR|nr:unnamed protein product [Moneuplotes crassus]